MAAARDTGPVTVRCPGCGTSWTIARRADGTLPKTARCAQRRGGCGHVVKVPKQGRAPRRPASTPAADADSAEPAVWNPPSEHRRAYQLDEPCPHCGQARVHAEP